MLEIGVQTKDAVLNDNPLAGFQMLARAGFKCVDFSLNEFLYNKEIYNGNLNGFFAKSKEELFEYFTPHKEAAKAAGIRIHQMHMPYPVMVPTGKKEVNDFLVEQVAPKSLEICAFLDCKYIVIHGLKLMQYLGSEEAEWQETEKFLDMCVPFAKEHGITLCIENLYNSNGKLIVEGPCCNVRRVVKRIDAFNEKHGAEVLGFCFDMGHANLVGIDPCEFLTGLGPRLKVMHLHDNDGVADLHQMPFTFTKTRDNRPSTDWDGFIKGLKNIDFKGVLSFETAPILSSFPEVLKEDALRLIARIGEYLAEAIENE